MIFDTLAAMTDWIDNKKFDKTATQDEIQAVLNDLANKDSSRQVLDPITKSGAIDLPSDEERAMRIFAWGTQNSIPRAVLEQMMTSSSSSSSSNSSSSSQNFIPTGVRISVAGRSGTAAWAGYTWTLPADSGKSYDITAAPAGGSMSIQRTQYKSYFYPETMVGQSWLTIRTSGNTTLAPNILMGRSFSKSTSGGSTYAAAMNRVMFYDLKGAVDIGDKISWSCNNPSFNPTSTATPKSDLNKVVTANYMPTYSDYLMGDRFWGSWVDTSGADDIIYTWDKIS